MKYVGPHVSTEGGVEHAPLNAAKVGAKAFGLFVKNQLQWKAGPCGAERCTAFRQNMAMQGFATANVLAHAGYLINLANPDEAAHAKSMESFVSELTRCRELGLDRLNLHPGSHLRKLSPAQALARVSASINAALAATAGVTVVIENTAGQGGCLGATFDELHAIVDGVDDRQRIGICLDTAHLFAAGFDVATARGCGHVLDQFDKTVGLAFLKGMHLNDSKTGLGSHVDRHESLGRGRIGWGPFEHIMNDPRLDGVPLILETPEPELWADEIRQLYALVKQGN